MSMNNLNDDGRMTREQKERLLDWHQQEAIAWFDEQAELDSTFGAMMEAMDKATFIDLEPFEMFLAGEVAEKAASGVREGEWLATALIQDNVEMSAAFKREATMQSSPYAAQRLNLAIVVLKENQLWPW